MLTGSLTAHYWHMHCRRSILDRKVKCARSGVRVHMYTLCLAFCMGFSYVCANWARPPRFIHLFGPSRAHPPGLDKRVNCEVCIHHCCNQSRPCCLLCQKPKHSGCIMRNQRHLKPFRCSRKLHLNGCWYSETTNEMPQSTRWHAGTGTLPLGIGVVSFMPFTISFT